MSKSYFYYRMVVFVPVWLLTILLKPALRSGHPWKGRYLTLRSWAENGTKLAEECSLVFWVSGGTLLMLSIRFYILWK